MAKYSLKQNSQANESVSKFKLLSAYGGPGSILHTQFGSIIISCIEEWGFLNKVLGIYNEALADNDINTEEDYNKYVKKQCLLSRNGGIEISNDIRFLKKFIIRKGLNNLKYFVLVPDIELNEISNSIKDFRDLSISSSYMPKVFSDKNGFYDSYANWFSAWMSNCSDARRGSNEFFPPKKIWCERKLGSADGQWHEQNLIQDNVVLICDAGHISDFPWSQYLNWRINNPTEISKNNPIALFQFEKCCSSPQITINSATSNASGFDGKWLKCNCCKNQVSLKGLFNVLVKCPGHKPWEAATGNADSYFGDRNSRNSEPPSEQCDRNMKVALTTANNLYFSRIMSSIYMPSILFKSESELRQDLLEADLIKYRNLLNTETDNDIIRSYENKLQTITAEINDYQFVNDDLSDSDREVQFRHQEYIVLNSKSSEEINIDEDHLKVVDATCNIEDDKLLKNIFSKIIRVDNMKITSAQLDFTRVQPLDADSDIKAKNIFKNNPANVVVYPVVENYGEGIFFSFNPEHIEQHSIAFEKELENWTSSIKQANDSDFHKSATDKAFEGGWELYMVHTFAHLIMRELEFKCGYPTASLQERIYVSNDNRFKMYGCLIYTAEGAEGSMGGLIAQTKGDSLKNLIRSALKRATICNSDPLCWESEGQGLFDLNFASCFSCSLVSETSCELRNIYLDRKILIDEKFGVFHDLFN